MFCPKCGAAGQGLNTYCKRCGDWLEDRSPNSLLRFGGSSPEQSIKILMLLSLLGVLLSLLAAGALLLHRSGHVGTHWSVKISAGFSITVALWQLSIFIIGSKLRNRLQRSRASEKGRDIGGDEGHSRTSALRDAETARFANTEAGREHPTELLEPSRRTEQEQR